MDGQDVNGHLPPTGVFVLRRGLFGYRRSDVLAALAEQRRQIEGLARSVDRLWNEKERAWRANYVVSQQLVDERSRHEAELAAERIRVVQVKAEARVAAANALAEAEEKAARIQTAAGASFVELAATLRELSGLRDQVVREVRSTLGQKEAPRLTESSVDDQLDEMLARRISATPA